MSRSPTTAEATPEARRTIAPVARTPATTFLLTFSARAKASAAIKTTAEMMTANQMAQDFDTARKIRDAHITCLLYTSPSPRDRQKSRMPSSA